MSCFWSNQTLTRLPWESMTALMSETVTRVPSLASLKVLLTMHKERVDKPRLCGVDQSDAVAVVDPENNLENSAQFLLPQFTSYVTQTSSNTIFDLTYAAFLIKLSLGIEIFFQYVPIFFCPETVYSADHFFFFEDCILFNFNSETN